MNKYQPRKPTEFDKAVDKIGSYQERPYGTRPASSPEKASQKRGLPRKVGAAALAGAVIGATATAFGPAVVSKGEHALRDLTTGPTPAQVHEFQTRNPREETILQQHRDEAVGVVPSIDGQANSH